MHTARYIVMYAVCMGNYIDELLANKSSSSSSSSSNLCCLLARSVSIYVSLIASTMCDLFWQSPADQGDLADVVRASLQVAPRPAATDKLQDQADMSSSSSYDLQLVEEAGGHHQQHQQQQQLVVSLSHGEDEKQWRQQSMPASANCGDDLDAMLLLLPPPPAEAAMIHDGVQDQPELGGAHPISPHIKRRNKSQTKKVVCIPAASGRGGGGGGGGGGEVVPSDLWAWRKYGQKPIKGSPYPRGYYRCSSSKGCSARKQVERSRADPTMLVVTYTSDHNHPWPTHRNALAGSTRPSSSAAKTISTTTTSCIHQYDDQSTDDHDGAARRRRHLKQEDAASLFAGITMDDNIIFSAGSNSQPQQQDQLPCTVDSKQQLLFEYPPHCSNFGFFD
ncbi:hypothetical protein GUJ93_ZPchr0012g21917 [Zizania palustris]|uniref:WRKY domain-containing protein n=1 Tax=Zizania palustris TaxID=103762 RepID=A0A8J5WPX6_ZIZPA|nr:hypothetical protein GUJ93_ZPchr0012g21917 [Zizania palustris]